MRSEVGGVKERQWKDKRSEKEPVWKHLQEEQFKPLLGRNVPEDLLSSLQRNSVLILRTLLSDHVSNYRGRYIWCCRGKLVIKGIFKAS